MKLIDEISLPRLIAAAAELGTMTALITSGIIKPSLTKRSACLMYGTANIEQWVNDGMLIPESPARKGAQPRFDRLSLETLYAAKEVADCLEDYRPLPNQHFSN